MSVGNKSVLDLLSERIARTGNRLDDDRTITSPQMLKILQRNDHLGLHQYLTAVYPLTRMKGLRLLSDEELDVWQVAIQNIQLERREASGSQNFIDSQNKPSQSA